MSKRRRTSMTPEESEQTRRILARSCLYGIGLAGIAYLLLSFTNNTAIYNEVLRSNGNQTLNSVRSSYLIMSAICCFPVFWGISAGILAVITPRPRKSFDFTDDTPHGASVADNMNRWRRPAPQYRPLNLRRISPAEFEHLVADMIEQNGKGYRTRVVGGKGDGGIDVEVFNEQRRLVGIVQCKRYDPDKALSPAFVRELATVRQMRGVKRAYLATTAHFSHDTHLLAMQLGIDLVSGDDLLKMHRARHYQSSQ